jgi:hypothetical protein
MLKASATKPLVEQLGLGKPYAVAASVAVIPLNPSRGDMEKSNACRWHTGKCVTVSGSVQNRISVPAFLQVGTGYKRDGRQRSHRCLHTCVQCVGRRINTYCCALHFND